MPFGLDVSSLSEDVVRIVIILWVAYQFVSGVGRVILAISKEGSLSEALKSVTSEIFKSKSDDREHRQKMETFMAEAQLRITEAETAIRKREVELSQQRESYREEQLHEIIHTYQVFIQEELISLVKEVSAKTVTAVLNGNSYMEHEMTYIRGQLEQIRAQINDIRLYAGIIHDRVKAKDGNKDG